MGVAFVALALLLVEGRVGAEPVRDLRCEWRVNPAAVADPCPEFWWQANSQRAFRLCVAETRTALASGPLVWDTGKRTTSLSIVEYAGPSLESGKTYWWRVTVWEVAGNPLPPSPPQHFTVRTAPAPHHLPTLRTFINFAGTPEFAGEWLDLCFRPEAKQGRRGVLVITYALVSTMTVPHPSTHQGLTGKSAALKEFCARRGLAVDGIAEDMFCHFAADTTVKLRVGAERAANPVEARVCPGWDPRNDRNHDGRVDDNEFAHRANPHAGARTKEEARVPIYYWGPPTDDFVMNVGNPDYQDFMATVWAPRVCAETDGIYFDTVPPQVPGPGRSASVLEYPRTNTDSLAWQHDLQRLFAKLKIRLPDKRVVANAWTARPLVIDGRQAENWERLALPATQWRRRLDAARDLDRDGKVQLLQYNPIYDPKLSEFGEKLPVTTGRDKLYGLATYLLIHGRYTYFGFGRHPYAHAQKLWFPAMKVDLGAPKGEYYPLTSWDAGPVTAATNLLTNGGFEQTDRHGQPSRWLLQPPVERDPHVSRTGVASIRIDSRSTAINNINRQFVTLKPNRVYTLTAWARTKGVVGSPGAQVYPYEFTGAAPRGMMTWTGTHDWQEQQLVFRTGPDPTGRINFRMYGAVGTVWFDDLHLVEGVHLPQQVFARRYEKGLVLVRPNVGIGFADDTASEVALPGLFHQLDVSGTPAPRPIHILRLRNGEGAVLIEVRKGGES